jgi:hypothetical protein
MRGTYYGFFKMGRRHGFGRKFYSEEKAMAEKKQEAKKMMEQEFRQWENLFSQKGYWQGMFKNDMMHSLISTDASQLEANIK